MEVPQIVEVPQIQFLDKEMVRYWWACCWFDSGCMVCVSSWVLFDGFFHIFYVVVYSDPEVVSAHLEIGHYVYEPLYLAVPWSLFWVYSSSRNACFCSGYMSAPGGRFSSCSPGALVFVGGGEVWTVDAPVCPSCFSLKSGHYVHEPCVSGSQLFSH